MRSKEEILHDIECCYGELNCESCNMNSFGLSCEELLNKEMVELIKSNEQKLEVAYNAGMEDAYEITRKLNGSIEIGGLSWGEIETIFGTRSLIDIYTGNTIYEIKSKIETWEGLKGLCTGDEIEAGDVKAIILDQYSDEGCYVFTETGCVEDWTINAGMKKNG